MKVVQTNIKHGKVMKSTGEKLLIKISQWDNDKWKEEMKTKESLTILQLNSNKRQTVENINCQL